MRKLFYLFIISAFLTSNGESSEGEKRDPFIEIKGIFLIGGSDMTLNDTSHMEGVKSIGLKVPGGMEALNEKLASLYLHKKLTKPLLASLKKTISQFFEEKKLPLVLVEIPKQDVTKGVVQIVISQSRLGEILCQGNEYFTCSQLESYINISPGECINTDDLLSDISFMNRNPFRTTKAVFAPGKEEHTTDVLLVTEDRLPWRFYVGGDNTGNDYTGNARWFAGVNWGNVLNLGHLFSYQYTTSSDFHEFQAHTFQYTFPLRYYRHIISIYGGLSIVHPSLGRFTNDVQPPAMRISNNGHTSQVSGRYTIPFGKTWNSTSQEFVWGFDLKHMNNNLNYIGDNTIPIFSRTVNTIQYMFAYNLGLASEKHRFAFNADVYFAPFQLIGGSGNSNFNDLRRGAQNRYIYTRFALKDTYLMGWDFNLFTSLRLQAANNALLPSEQLGLGGYDTVRGYDERDFNADNAVVFNLELHFPKLNLFCRSGKLKKEEQFYFLLFTDFADGKNYRTLAGERKNEWLGSFGPGVRYYLGRYIQFRFDYGMKFHKDSLLGRSFGKFHIGAIASY